MVASSSPLKSLKAGCEVSVEVIASVDGNGHFLSVSPTCFAAWKVSPNELLGTSLFDIIHPEDVLLAQQALLATSFMNQAKSFEGRIVCPDKVVVSMNWTAQWSEVDNATLLVAEKAKAQAAAAPMMDTRKESKEKLRLVLDALPVGVFLATTSGKIEFANKALENMMGTGAIGLDARPIHSVFPISGTGKQAEATLLNYVDKLTEMQVKTDHERKISVEFSLKRINVGGVLMYLGTALDINERIELVAIKQKFIEVVSEQIKVPLARAMGFIQQTLQGLYGNLDSSGKGRGEVALSDMQKAILALDAMVEVDKLETGSFDVELSPNSIMVLVKQGVLSMLHDIREADLVFEINGPDGEVMADEARMFQVIKTLLSNAIKVSPRGSKVRVQIVEENNRMRVEFIDRGCGLSEDQKKAIFDRFRQPSTDGDPNALGNGKSLLVAKYCIEKHGGSMGVFSSPGTGSNFWFDLPKANL